MAAAAGACLPLVPLFYTSGCGSNAITRCSISSPMRSTTTTSNVIFHNYDYCYKPSSMIRSCRRRRVACYSAASSTSAGGGGGITEFDLYELMGIDSSCDPSEIKRAYRTLQKRCHPDIAGPAGHDMAIILNEAYALLSDPNSRSAYDKEQAKIAELRGYSGKPIYSVWFGSESEERAVFVDEVKCIGCLKCALCAEKTFAIESVYGRARVVGQWADPESKIQEAIQACPVDCISIVERSNLAALEFLMSKQPRGSVRIGMGTTAGARVSNIFVDLKKFQTRFQDAAKQKASSTQTSSETDLQREARLSAIQAIRSISNWLYWKTPYSTSAHHQSTSLQNFTQSSIGPTYSSHFNHTDVSNLLREAAAARKQGRYQRRTRPVRPLNPPSSKEEEDNDYWKPLTNALPHAAAATSASSTQNNHSNSSQPSPAHQRRNVDKDYRSVQRNPKPNPIRWLAPMAPAILMAAVVGQSQSQGHGGAVGNGNGGGGGLTEHIYGSFALEIVNSSWLQIVLVAITWYIIGMVIVGLVDAIKSRQT
ncbi:hypothetical protein L3X38_006412 [Prunus dulcis]|uniref:J domain-containing protein n=1 Tax=Prunus dulcis TaxID=3755 RepID=A0AAD4ZSM5_PRUDU|nr:hypothetical protein L3X38_006412 [Prunus dulcis]